MKLGIKKSGKYTYLYAIKSYRDHNGKFGAKTVEKFGTVEKLRDQLNGEDPIEWAKKEVEKMTLQEKEEKKPVVVNLLPTVQLDKDNQQSYNGGYLFLQKIYYDLGLHTVCKSISNKYKFEYNLNSILSRLLYSRILFPASKLATNELSKKYIEQPKFDLHQIYRALSLLTKECDTIQAAVYKNSLKTINRQTGVIYYDCTNYFFEIEQADGLKQYGVSKEHRPNPLVQMGLFMDADGIPLSFDINPGNTNEQITLRPMQQKLQEDFGLSKMVVCTDAGLSSLENRKYNDVGSRGFITTQSIKMLKGHIKEWALSSDGWSVFGSDSIFNINELDNNKDYSEVTFYKERWINENGLEQRILVTFSLKYLNFTRRKRAEQIGRAIDKINNNPSKINSKRGTDYKRFIEQTSCTNDGEIASIKEYSINQQRIIEEEKYDGFYAVCTNLEDDAKSIVKINHRRWEIEESFRIMKSEFKARPVYLKKDDRIKAHFLTCFLSLLIFRILEKRTESIYSSHNLVSTLAEMNFANIASEGFIPTYTRSDITDDLHRIFDFRTDYQIISKKSMNEIISYTKNSRSSQRKRAR